MFADWMLCLSVMEVLKLFLTSWGKVSVVWHVDIFISYRLFVSLFPLAIFQWECRASGYLGPLEEEVVVSLAFIAKFTGFTSARTSPYE